MDAGEQQQQWDDEERVRKARAAEMQKRVEMEEEEIRRNPERASKKIVGAIQNMGVKPDRDVVDKLAAKAIAFRRHNSLKKEGNDLFKYKAMAKAVRKKVEEYEDKVPALPAKSTKTKCNHEKPAPMKRDQRELKWQH
jgi:hypothetical protein